MTIVGHAGSAADAGAGRAPQLVLSPGVSRALLASIVIVAFGTGVLADAATSSRAVLDAGDDLTRLMRFMALIKGALAAGVVGAVLWRFGSNVTLPRFAAYGAVCATMVAGPGLIWGMAHVGLGAFFLHGGLVASIVLLWRDPAVPMRLAAALDRRRARRHA